MTEYICKCGKEIQKSTDADVTGNRLENYAPEHECFGCPYVVEVQKWTKYPEFEIIHECEMSSHILNRTTCSGFGNNNNSCAVLSLDFDFLREVADYCLADEHLTINREENGNIFGYKSSYQANGLYRLPIYPTSNKAGIAAKMAIFDKFFNDQGERKDTGGADETEIIQAQIARGKADARGEEMQTTEIENVAPDINVGSMAEEITKDNFVDVMGVEFIIESMRLTGKQAEDALFWIGRSKQKPDEVLSDLCSSYEDCTTCPVNHGCTVEPEESILEYLCKEWHNRTDKRTETHACDLERTETHEPTISETETVEPLQEVISEMETTTEKTSVVESDHRSTLVASPLDAVSAALAPAFDYAALDEKTASVLLAAENLIVEARRYYITECANAVGIAHDALCGEACRTVRQARNNQYSENTFLSWCDSVGLKKDTAYRFLQVNALMKGSTIEEQAILEQAPATLLYAAAKPSAPADLVQGVKDGDITTNADYQKLLREKQDLEQEKAQLENDVQCLDENLTESLKRGHETTHKVHEAELKAIKAEEQAQQAKRDFKTVSDVVTQKTAENARLRREAFEATEREQELERKVRELEARPVDVAVQQPSAADIERYRKEGEAAAAAEWKERCDYIEAQNQYLNDAMREREEVALTMQDAEYDTQDEVAAFIYGVGKRAAETVESALALFFETAYEQPDIVYRPALQFLLETHEKFTTAINTGRWFYDVEEVEDELE